MLFISLNVRAVELVILVKPISISTHVLMSISLGTKIPTFLNILVLLKVVGCDVSCFKILDHASTYSQLKIQDAKRRFRGMLGLWSVALE